MLGKLDVSSSSMLMHSSKKAGRGQRSSSFQAFLFLDVGSTSLVASPST
jgi:hypothetical protein